MGVHKMQPELGQHLAEFGHGQTIRPGHIDPTQQQYLDIRHFGSCSARKGGIFASRGAPTPVMG